MTNEEAISYLGGFGYAKFETECADKDLLNAIEIAISALKKQIPKKPKFEHRRVLDLYVCECGVDFGNSLMMIKPQYCHNCGQKLDWSDENDRAD